MDSGPGKGIDILLAKYVEWSYDDLNTGRTTEQREPEAQRLSGPSPSYRYDVLLPCENG
jgi:hypothetical protein